MQTASLVYKKSSTCRNCQQLVVPQGFNNCLRSQQLLTISKQLIPSLKNRREDISKSPSTHTYHGFLRQSGEGTKLFLEKHESL